MRHFGQLVAVTRPRAHTLTDPSMINAIGLDLRKQKMHGSRPNG
jgi:hypothetical protein